MTTIAARTPRRESTSSGTEAPGATEPSVESAEQTLRSFVAEHRASRTGLPGEFERFERRVMELGVGVVRATLAEEMAAQDVAAEAIVVKGKTLRRVLRSKQQYQTIAGVVGVERWLFKDRSDPESRSVSPLDMKLGIVDGFWTPEAAKQGAWVVSQMTPGKAEELFSRAGTMRPSKSSLDRLPKELSERWEERREAFEEQLRASLEIPESAVTVAVSIDGVMAPMEGTKPVEKRQEAARRGRVCKGPVGYRELGVATLSFCDAKGDALAAVRFGRAPESKKVTLKGQMLAEVMSALRKRPDLRVVKIADGGGDNWEFLGELCADREGTDGCLDFFHATEHLHTAMTAAYGEATLACRHRYEEHRHTLRHDPDGAKKVIRALAYLAKSHPGKSVLKRELAYFRKNRHLMGYAAMKQAGLPIGSGMVEAACKSLVTQRLKLSGMRWGMEGSQAILTLRGWDQSDRFDEAWAMLAASYQCEVHVLAHVIPIRATSR
jgi:hypothetical protein